MQLETPTRELIEKYRKAFEHRNSAEEEAIIEIFKIFPNNKDYKGVLLKSIVINTLYGTRIMRIDNIARHICELDIDDRFKVSDSFAGVPEAISRSYVGSLRRA